MIKAFHSVAIVVSNAKKAAKWYVEKLGFKLLDKQGHWVTISPKGSKTVFHLCEMKKLEPGNTGIALTSDDVDKTYAQLAKNGVKFTQKPMDHGWGKFAKFKDPDGNVFWSV